MYSNGIGNGRGADSSDEEIPLLTKPNSSAINVEVLHSDDEAGTSLLAKGIVPTPLAIALHGANAKQDIAGQKIKVGPYTIDHNGVHAPNEIAIHDISSKKYLTYIMIGAFLAAASGASGYAGASAAGGLWIGLGSWVATSALNFVGWENLVAFLCESNGMTGPMVIAIAVGYVAALTPAILAGEGAVELGTGEVATDITQMPTSSLGWLVPFATVNEIVSGALNITSLLNLLLTFKKFYKRIFCGWGAIEFQIGSKTTDVVRAWENKCAEGLVRILLFIYFFPATYAAIMGTVARGFSTYKFVADLLGEGWAYEIFGLTGAPGFAMFLGSLLKLALFIEDLIKYVLRKLIRRRLASFSALDIVTNGLAVILAGFFAMMVYRNYQGLAEKAYNPSWGLGELLISIVVSLQAFLFPAAFSAAANMVMRVQDFARYLINSVEFIWYRNLSVQRQIYFRGKADEIWMSYSEAYPEQSQRFATFVHEAEKYFSHPRATEPTSAPGTPGYPASFIGIS